MYNCSHSEDKELLETNGRHIQNIYCNPKLICPAASSGNMTELNKKIQTLAETVKANCKGKKCKANR